MNAGLAEMTFIGVVIAVLSIPPTLGWVPRNRAYGFRVPATLRSDEVWYAINRRFGIELIVAGAALAALATSLDVAGLETPVVRVAALPVTLGVLLLITVRGWRAANRMERGYAVQQGR